MSTAEEAIANLERSLARRKRDRDPSEVMYLSSDEARALIEAWRRPTLADAAKGNQ